MAAELGLNALTGPVSGCMEPMGSGTLHGMRGRGDTEQQTAEDEPVLESRNGFTAPTQTRHDCHTHVITGTGFFFVAQEAM